MELELPVILNPRVEYDRQFSETDGQLRGVLAGCAVAVGACTCGARAIGAVVALARGVIARGA